MSLRSDTRDQLMRLVYALGWRTAGRLPDALVAQLISRGARLAQTRNGLHVRQLRRNLELATNWPVTDDLVQRAVGSYLRNLTEVLALPSWSPAEIKGRVRTVNGSVLKRAFAGPGAVVALPHSGNWDLAGAWAVHSGMPVTTVAERLADADFDAFVRFRRQLGIEVLSDHDPQVIVELIAAVRRRRLVCLVADRDLLGTGLPVTWAGHPVTMPAGPALVARRTGAQLIPAVCQFADQGMVITFGDPVPAEPGRAGLTAMTQTVADFFARTIARRPADWHMMQPFFAPRTEAAVRERSR